MSQPDTFSIGRITAGLFAFLLAFLFVYPFLWQIRTAFSDPAGIMSTTWNPATMKLTVSNLNRVFTQSDIPRYMLNGLIVVIAVLIGQVVVAMPAAFALARYRFRGSSFLMALVIGAIAFPGFVMAVPNFVLLATANLLDTTAALVLPFWGSAFGVFLFRQAIARIPQDFLDAGVIDGCGIPRLIVQVVSPLVTSHLVTFALFSVSVHWNDLFWPLVVIRTSRKLTASAGVLFFASSEMGTEWGPVSAASLIVVLPIVLFFVFVAKRLDRGLGAAVLR